MNRQQRRQMEKAYRHAGLSKEIAKMTVEANYAHPPLEEGQKVRLNYELMKRHPHYKIQKDGFIEWVEAHKDEVFTVQYNEEKVNNNALDVKINVNLAEDTTEPKWLFKSETLIPLATATIKLDSGEEKKVVLGDVTSEKDPSIMEKVNEALKEEE